MVNDITMDNLSTSQRFYLSAEKAYSGKSLRMWMLILLSVSLLVSLIVIPFVTDNNVRGQDYSDTTDIPDPAKTNIDSACTTCKDDAAAHGDVASADLKVCSQCAVPPGKLIGYSLIAPSAIIIAWAIYMAVMYAKKRKDAFSSAIPRPRARMAPLTAQPRARIAPVTAPTLTGGMVQSDVTPSMSGGFSTMSEMLTGGAFASTYSGMFH
jgi:hypothetical protein